MFVPLDEPLRVVRLSLENLDSKSREIDLISYHPWVLGNGVATEDSRIETAWDPELQVLMARRPGRSDGEQYRAFSGLFGDQEPVAVHFTSNRTSFLGQWGTVDAPAAVVRSGPLKGEVGAVADPCAALLRRIGIPAGGRVTVWWIVGEASAAGVHDLIRRYHSAAIVSQELERARDYWRSLLGTLHVETPSAEFDLLLNGWLTYQNVVCRMWGRSSYYQGGGAFGFRDQLQDACALCWHRPEWTRHQVLLHAAHQFSEGDVLHWWHPPDGRGLRTRFSDDLLWLPWAALEYVDATGDDAVWDTEVPFRQGDSLDANELERFIRPWESDEKATLYDHCCRALDKSNTQGAHGLPLIGCGDWNDGFSRVGAAGQGESVWVAMFLCAILPRFVDVCRSRGDQARARRYEEQQMALRTAVNEQGWDGGWYRRAFLDNGEPLGSHVNDECRIDALVQAWAILAGVANAERAAQILQQVDEQLVDDEHGIIRLLTPAFHTERRDVGYIRGYLPGIRENGGQYTHGVLWFLRALAKHGNGHRATQLWEMITPIRHTSTAERAAVYGAEPYVVAADVYGEPPHTGRAGWTWYTGSAGWMFRVAVESILGWQLVGGRQLRIQPRIPPHWPGYQVTYTLPGSTTAYRVDVQNPQRGTTPTSAQLDGQQLTIQEGAVLIPLDSDGELHRVTIHLA